MLCFCHDAYKALQPRETENKIQTHIPCLEMHSAPLCSTSLMLFSAPGKQAHFILHWEPSPNLANAMLKQVRLATTLTAGFTG